MIPKTVILLAFGILTMVLAALCLPHQTETGDVPTYTRPAQNLVRGKGFTVATPSGQDIPEYRRTPGYPCFLASIYLFSESPSAVLMTQRILFLVMALGCYVFLRRVVGDPVAFVAALLLLADVPCLLMSNAIVSEPLFAVWIVLSAFLLYEAGRRESVGFVCLSAATLGVATLTRPIALLLFVIYAGYLAASLPLRRKRLVLAALFVIVANILPATWVFRNHALSGVWTLTSIQGPNMLYYRALPVEALATGRSEQEVRKDLETRANKAIAQEAARLGRPLNQPEASRIEGRLGAEIARAYPFLSLRVGFVGMAKMMLGPGYPAYVTRFGPFAQKAIHVFQYALSGFFLLLSCVGVVWAFRQRQLRGLVALSCALIAYFILMSAGSMAYSRFRVPIAPFYYLLISWAIVNQWPRFGRGSGQSSSFG